MVPRRPRTQREVERQARRQPDATRQHPRPAEPKPHVQLPKSPSVRPLRQSHPHRRQTMRPVAMRGPLAAEPGTRRRPRALCLPGPWHMMSIQPRSTQAPAPNLRRRPAHPWLFPSRHRSPARQPQLRTPGPKVPAGRPPFQPRSMQVPAPNLPSREVHPRFLLSRHRPQVWRVHLWMSKPSARAVRPREPRVRPSQPAACSPLAHSPSVHSPPGPGPKQSRLKW